MKLEKKIMEYAKKAANLCVRLYSWYSTPPTMHTKLIQRSYYVRAIYIAIGQLSEETTEASNEHFHLF